MKVELLISIISAAAAIATIVVSIWYNRRTLASARLLATAQSKANFFVIYTGRYMELVKQKPDFASCTERERMAFMRQYFNLCSEEFYLHSRGMIDKNVWQMWVNGMRLTMRGMKFKVSWRELAVNYDDAFWPWFEKEVVTT